MKKREGNIKVPIDPGEVNDFFTLQLPVGAEIRSASFASDNGDYFLVIHYMAYEDNRHSQFKEFRFETKRYFPSEEISSSDSKTVHLCSLREGLYTYGVFYTP